MESLPVFWSRRQDMSTSPWTRTDCVARVQACGAAVCRCIPDFLNQLSNVFSMDGQCSQAVNPVRSTDLYLDGL